MHRITAGEVKEFVLREGADCVGIANPDAIPESFPPRKVTDILPRANSVVVFGMAMLNGAIESPLYTVASSHSNALYEELVNLSNRLGRFLERRGYKAATPSIYLPIENRRETKGLVGELSLRHAGVAAGLGVLGRSRLLLTREFGPRLRLAAVVTDAELAPDKPLEEDLCSDCRLCIEACPVQAISDGGQVDTIKCLFHLQPFGLAPFIRFLSDLFAKSTEEKQKAVRDPLFWNFYQTQSLGLTYHCFQCLIACPVGR